MESRKVQKTGDMNYIYLPTKWCKKHNIKAQSFVSIREDANGALVLSATDAKPRAGHLSISIKEDDEQVINRLLVACYLNPLAGFKIELPREMTAAKLLRQKKLVSLESVEIDKKTILSDSSVMLTDPDLLLKTMVKKIKNLVVLMRTNYNLDLITRYEEEIDRSRMLIQKAVINYMALSMPVHLKTIDLYYISLLAQDLERMVDHVIGLREKDTDYLEKLSDSVQHLKEITDSLDLRKGSPKPHYRTALGFVKKVGELPKGEEGNKGRAGYNERRIRELLSNVSEVLLDWSITNQIESI